MFIRDLHTSYCFLHNLKTVDKKILLELGCYKIMNTGNMSMISPPHFFIIHNPNCIRKVTSKKRLLLDLTLTYNVFNNEKNSFDVQILIQKTKNILVL